MKTVLVVVATSACFGWRQIVYDERSAGLDAGDGPAR